MFGPINGGERFERTEVVSVLQQGHVDELVSKLVENEGSDLHLKVGAPLAIRVHGSLDYIEDYEVLRPIDTEEMLAGIILQKLVEEFEEDGEADFSYAVQGVGRFQVNAFRQRGSRIILVTGTTGNGKSTTLASMINLVNRTSSKHTVTIEDPIEFLHLDEKSIINQREVGQDTVSYARALKRVLRQDPDIILIGEIRDSESAQIALSAAETGHLVLSTLHALDATETINRMIDLFPPHERSQVRTMLAGTLKGIVGQRLIRTKDGEGRAAACEVMVSTGRIKDFILDPEQTGQIQTAIAEGEYYGMQTFDQALLKLIGEDRVSYEEALKIASRPQDFRLMVQSLGLGAAR